MHLGRAASAGRQLDRERCAGLARLPSVDQKELDRRPITSRSLSVSNPPANPPGEIAADLNNSGRETVVPLFEEEVNVAKRVVETGRVQVSRITHTHQHMVDELLRHEKVEVERIPMERPVDT